MQDPNKLLTKIVRRLRTIGTDTQLVEVKEAAWKLPESIGETLSAFMTSASPSAAASRRSKASTQGAFTTRSFPPATPSRRPAGPTSTYCRSKAPKSWPPSFRRSNPT